MKNCKDHLKSVNSPTNRLQSRKVLNETIDEILIAFRVKYDLEPNEVILYCQDDTFFVEARDQSHIKKISDQRIKFVDDLFNKYTKLLEFVKKSKLQSCCNVCNCLSCDAKKILEDIGEL